MQVLNYTDKLYLLFLSIQTLSVHSSCVAALLHTIFYSLVTSEALLTNCSTSYLSVSNCTKLLCACATQDVCGKPTQGRQIALIDPQCRVTVLHLYAGLLKVVPLELDSAHPLKAFNVR